ncbi:MAG: coenzyme F420-0:L-glutamate ligase [Candidatus Ranarchaeia archaeon]
MRGEATILTIIPVKGLPLIRRKDDIAFLLVKALRDQSLILKPDDILVVVQSIISKSEGRVVDLSTITPSEKAREIAKQIDKPPELVELILRESKRIERLVPPHIIVETHHGFVCANAGIDASNSGGRNHVTLLPEDPDKSARLLQRNIKKLTGIEPGIIITDTHGRPFREGAVNVAIGVAGIPPVLEYIGRSDLYGYELRTTKVAVADEIAAAAELVTGESDEGVPIVIVRGLSLPKGDYSIDTVIRSRDKDIFRH